MLDQQQKLCAKCIHREFMFRQEVWNTSKIMKHTGSARSTWKIAARTHSTNQSNAEQRRRSGESLGMSFPKQPISVVLLVYSMAAYNKHIENGKSVPHATFSTSEYPFCIFFYVSWEVLQCFLIINLMSILCAKLSLVGLTVKREVY